MTIDIFFRRENKNFDPSRIFTHRMEVDFEVNDFAAVSRVMQIARERRIIWGTARSGIFEIQTDEGIWSHINERRIDVSTPGKASNVVFKSWNDLEIEEAA